MWKGLRRTLTGAAVGCVLLTGCSSTVVGSASAGAGEPTDVSPDEFPIVNAEDGNAVDQGMRNALTDLYGFWEKAYPEAYGEDFVPLRGPVFSVDVDNIDPSAFPDGVSCGNDPHDVENNAFFCAGNGVPNSDSITYDRNFLAGLTEHFGDALVPVVMAHEFGHAIQYRTGEGTGESIDRETQADCFAGAWTRWVVDGHAQHVSIRVPELDDVLRGFFQVRDPAGYDPGAANAHGSFFDRVNAIAEGYDNGVPACRDNFGPDRIFTAASFTDADLQNEGNSSYDEVLSLTEDSLPAFWDGVFSEAFGKDFQDPGITSFDGKAPDCVQGNRDLGYCADDTTVYYDEKDLTRPAYDAIGDFAVATAISVPYALAVRQQAGLSTDDAAATKSAVCLTGWWTAQLFSRRDPNVRLQPGDIDEAVEFLLTYGVDDKVFPNTDLSGFELLRSYRSGFFDAAGACDVGL
jgi:predicted metalloprotease